MSRPPRKPEVMSPVGGYPQLRAAVEAGADAVFFGVNPPKAAARQDGAGFHARAKVGFASEELPDIMTELHGRGVLGFVTFNVLVFDRELRQAEEQLMFLAESGVDAIIVQDLGIARLAHQICPDLPIHGSTQMSITSAEGAALAARFGARRVVLGRELSLRDIEKIAQQTHLELETFVHGALCVSYSGQCFSSEAWGGRSANRGQCAQACRMPYDLWVDGTQRDLGAARYLLSPGDLYALHQVPELIRIGVDCLKIEGRYKDPDYVALTTAAYRQAVDEAWAGLPLSITPQQEQDLEQVFSRGLGPHFMSGTNHQAVVEGRTPRHRGVYIGQVTGLTGRGVMVALEHDVRAGDGLMFDPTGWRRAENDEEGGFLYGVWQDGQMAEEGRAGQSVELRFAKGAIDPAGIRPGDPVWRTQDPTLKNRLPDYGEGNAVYTRPITLTLQAQPNFPAQLTLTDDQHHTAIVLTPDPLSTARNRPLTPQQAAEQLGKLGGTGFHAADIQVDLQGDLFMPVSTLNALRRDGVEQLQALRRQRPQRTAVPKLNEQLTVYTSTQRQQQKNIPSTSQPPALHLLVRTPDQLDAALTLHPASITLDYLELYGLKPSLERIRKSGLRARIASPRILKPSEQKLIHFLLSLDIDLLVRSGGLLEALTNHPQKPPIDGDFSLNAANMLTAHTLLELGLRRLTPTHDLNARQISELATLVGPQHLEVMVYHHLPVFHTEHCVFCRFLSDGTDYTNCGHPCEQHRIELRDHRHNRHPVMADVGCRNTVFEGRPQVANAFLPEWQGVGLGHFRLEFVHENAEQVHEIVSAYQAYFAQTISAQALDERISQSLGSATTQGSLYVPDDFHSLPPLPIL